MTEARRREIRELRETERALEIVLSRCKLNNVTGKEMAYLLGSMRARRGALEDDL